MGGMTVREGQTFAGESLLVRYVNFVKLPHTVFALPFALLGLLVASRQHAITWRTLGLVVLAFTCARFVALGFNRIADRELAQRRTLVSEQRARLAALGTAVTKINHDLRNILATARLVTDGLAASAAPEVRRVAPRLFDAIDRAVALCTRTLDFSREGTPPLAPRRLPLASLIDEVAPDLGLSEEGMAIECAIPPDLMIEADRDQLYRVLLNLARNAVEAGARRLRFSAVRENRVILRKRAPPGLRPPGNPPPRSARPMPGRTRAPGATPSHPPESWTGCT